MAEAQAKDQHREQIRHVLDGLNSQKVFTGEEEVAALDLLESCECWEPFKAIINQRIARLKGMDRLESYARLARIQAHWLDDVFAAAETCALLVNDTGIDYPAFCRDALSRIVEPEDFTTEGAILQAVKESFDEEGDRVLCLERLCLIYEKKKYNEALLHDCYQQLISVDPGNMKALKFFKMFHIQNHDFEKVIDVLESMFRADPHPDTRFRIAQEMATIYLYQLDQPEKALETLDRHCENSPLDSTTIRFEACYRLRDWEGSLGVLREFLLSIDSDEQRSIIYFKVGELEEQCGEKTRAEESYLKSHRLNPAFLEPLENLIEMGLTEGDWSKVDRHLEVLKNSPGAGELADQIEETRNRIRSGLPGAS